MWVRLGFDFSSDSSLFSKTPLIPKVLANLSVKPPEKYSKNYKSEIKQRSIFPPLEFSRFLTTFRQLEASWPKKRDTRDSLARRKHSTRHFRTIGVEMSRNRFGFTSIPSLISKTFPNTKTSTKTLGETSRKILKKLQIGNQATLYLPIPGILYFSQRVGKSEPRDRKRRTHGSRWSVGSIRRDVSWIIGVETSRNGVELAAEAAL